MSNGQLDIYKASAGSGKTHRLTHKYISFLLAPDAERDAETIRKHTENTSS